jgi:transcriptional regulator with XRE-family HTH domain
MNTRPHSRHSSISAGGNRVKDLRVELGLTRVEFARLAELSEKTLDRVERGAQTFRETTYRKIFNALNRARTKEGLSALGYQELFRSGDAPEVR